MRSLLLLAVLVFLTIPSSAQSEVLSAQVEWKRYKSARYRVSVVLPKLPLVREVANKCDDTLSTLHYAYADGVVYELAVSVKLPADRAALQSCLATVKRFGPAPVDERMVRLISAGLVSEKKLSMTGGRVVTKFKSEKSTHWIVSDFDSNDRWIELAVYHSPNRKIDAATFLKSLEFSDRAGTDIADGAGSMIGDPSVASSIESSSVSSGNSSRFASLSASTSPPDLNREDIRVISKPAARYTEEARLAGEIGAVRLKVTLLANGSVGEITVISPLKHGLSEQAIAAAKQIVFIPKKINDVAVTSVVTLDYTFKLH